MDHLTDNHFCSLLAARCGAVVFSLDYRLCPENAFPAPIEDARALWEHIQAFSVDYGVDPAHVALAGGAEQADQTTGLREAFHVIRRVLEVRTRTY